MDKSRQDRRDRLRRRVAYQATPAGGLVLALEQRARHDESRLFIRPPRSHPAADQVGNVRGSKSGDAPDVRNSAQAHYGIATDPDEKDSVALIRVKLLEGVFTAPIHASPTIVGEWLE
jgi:hypothetical protein